ncbi:hypothetical protein E2C01_002040 [Portunus trituberculatus]|uniref:Uncharacterized protein n=1 Tax=Portunus trituberculatus TaxID=210409 RepID=A0A5B7CIP5_PORTR|nr:hypothetical protein [Portunus trituberculatus]
MENIQELSPKHYVVGIAQGKAVLLSQVLEAVGYTSCQYLTAISHLLHLPNDEVVSFQKVLQEKLAVLGHCEALGAQRAHHWSIRSKCPNVFLVFMTIRSAKNLVWILILILIHTIVWARVELGLVLMMTVFLLT